MSLLRQPQPPASTSPLGEFEFLNVKGRPNGWNDPRFEKLWLYNLHYFEKYCTTELIERWIKENPIGHGNGWEPYPVSLRVVNWIKWLMRDQGPGIRDQGSGVGDQSTVSDLSSPIPDPLDVSDWSTTQIIKCISRCKERAAADPEFAALVERDPAAAVREVQA